MRQIAVFATAATLTVAAPGAAQNAEEEVLAVVHRLFDGMRAGDSAMVRSTFAGEARLVSTGPQGMQVIPVDRFVQMVGTPHDSIYDEPIWDVRVQIDGPLAAVWAKYAFFLGTQFSHCGVDAFQLHRGPEGWKIFHLADTRQREGCEMPPGR